MWRGGLGVTQVSVWGNGASGVYRLRPPRFFLCPPHFFIGWSFSVLQLRFNLLKSATRYGSTPRHLRIGSFPKASSKQSVKSMVMQGNHLSCRDTAMLPCMSRWIWRQLTVRWGTTTMDIRSECHAGGIVPQTGFDLILKEKTSIVETQGRYTIGFHQQQTTQHAAIWQKKKTRNTAQQCTIQHMVRTDPKIKERTNARHYMISIKTCQKKKNNCQDKIATNLENRTRYTKSSLF